jgi:hypothetical protein
MDRNVGACVAEGSRQFPNNLNLFELMKTTHIIYIATILSDYRRGLDW